MSMPEVTLLPESEFAERLGVARELVRAERVKLPEGSHWKKETGAGGRIMLTPAGATALLGMLATGLDQDKDDDLGGRAPELKPGTVAWLVTVKQVPNVYQVLARRPEDDVQAPAPFVLEVPIASEGGKRMNYFTPGLLVQARHLAGARWQYIGPKPRHRGDMRLVMWRGQQLPALQGGASE